MCPEELWLENVPQTEQAAPVCTHSSTQEKIECFLSMFRGREELYARRYYSTKTGKSGYTPVCKNEWVQGLCDKRRYKCADCPNRAFVSLNYEAVKAHLRGECWGLRLRWNAPVPGTVLMCGFSFPSQFPRRMRGGWAAVC